MENDPQYKPAAGGFNLGIKFGGINQSATNLKPTSKTGITGRLKAWDPVARKVVWETEGFVNDRPSGGATATAGGLVLQGNGAGKELRAYDAKTGNQLWSFNAQTNVYAAPITYELDGQQYVAASVGGNAAAQGGYFAPGYSRMLVFAIGGKAALPANAPYTPPPLDPPASTAAADVIKTGGEKYGQYCSVCHGNDGVQTRGTFPNLTVTPMLHTQEGFDQVVLQGARIAKGMGNFAKDLTPADSIAVREYLVSRANFVKQEQARAAAAAAPAPAADGNQHQAN
jgi:mono/diheme cytochrome c family protein